MIVHWHRFGEIPDIIASYRQLRRSAKWHVRPPHDSGRRMAEPRRDLKRRSQTPPTTLPSAQGTTLTFPLKHF